MPCPEPAPPRSLARPDPRAAARARIEEMIRRERLWGRRLLGERSLAAAESFWTQVMRGGTKEER